MRKVLLFITDGFSDWEASYVTAEINKPSTGYCVKTIAIDAEPKTSMGGLRVLPDYILPTYVPDADVAMLIIPGGTGWREKQNQQASILVDFCFSQAIPVAAICDATTFLGRYGFLDQHKHTSNSLAYLQEAAPDYKGEQHYIEAQSVRDRDVITANGTAAVEFTKHILELLQVYKDEQLEEWYTIFKHGLYQGTV
ncbi:type 1 glutamine amidotransferase family protein [Paenibacillus taiwanensis]|uniref:type 1 glutamine amidotransferase family protein n=1 Tax=Paenibacillus taiwanensis TaxID=401638 RepID=UPI00048F94EB|nr:type 1 glutamine amidotransferase family protein [Paenibacillus taiwanensis]